MEGVKKLVDEVMTQKGIVHLSYLQKNAQSVGKLRQPMASI